MGKIAQLLQRQHEAALIMLSKNIQAAPRRTEKSPHFKRKRMNWAARKASLRRRGKSTRDPFARRYRLNEEEFDALVEKLKVTFPTFGRRTWASRSGCSPHKDVISPELRLSITLRHLAGGSYLDIADMHGIDSDKTFYNIIWDTIDKILHVEGLPLDGCFGQNYGYVGALALRTNSIHSITLLLRHADPPLPLSAHTLPHALGPAPLALQRVWQMAPCEAPSIHSTTQSPVKL